MKVKINKEVVDSKNKTILEFNRAVDDLLWIYYHPKMFINEKNYTTKLIVILYEMGYYKDIESLFIERIKNERSISSVR